MANAMKNRYIVEGSVARIIAQDKYEILVDADDLDIVHERYPNTWTVNNTGINKRYVSGVMKGKVLWLSRYIMSAPSGMIVDHINRNTLDNRRSNLRIVTSFENGQNRSLQSNNKTGYRGVFHRKDTNKWIAYVYRDRKRHHLGSFDTPEEANAVAVYHRKLLLPYSYEGNEQFDGRVS